MIEYDPMHEAWFDDRDFDFNVDMSCEGDSSDLSLKFKSQAEFWQWYSNSNSDYPRIYTGIGSRKTPDNILNLFVELGKELAEMKLILRSGGAPGADSAFEVGCDLVNGHKRIFLPWKGFNNNKSELFGVSTKCVNIARKLIPDFNNRKYGAQLLTARNVYQIMGNTLQEPTDFIVCYCDGTGGTANTLKIAKHFGIKHIFNYYDYLNNLDKVKRLVLNHALKKID